MKYQEIVYQVSHLKTLFLIDFLSLSKEFLADEAFEEFTFEL